jgi:hypothetical protein
MITFDEAKHEYRCMGKRVESVTQILDGVFGKKCLLNATEWHLQRGQAAHKCYELLANGINLEDYDVDPELTGYIIGWQDWVNTCKPEFLQTETIVFSPTNWYCGKIDTVVLLSGKRTLIDYKASASPRDVLQLAGYVTALEEKVDQACTIEIDGSGKWKMSKMLKGASLRNAVAEWHAVNAVYKMKRRFGNG